MKELTRKSYIETLRETLENGITQELTHVPSIFVCGGGLDSESTTLKHVETDPKTKKQKTHVDACFNYAWQISPKPHTGLIVRTPYEICEVLRDTIHAVTEYNDTHGTSAKYIIWVANFAHEYAFIKGYLHNNFEVTKIFARNPRDVLIVELEKVVEIRECIGLFGHSLSDIAKNWCSKDNQKLKDTFNYELIRTYSTPLTETEKAYMYYDVSTLAEMHINVVRHYTQSNGACVLPYTSSGFVRLKLKDYIRDDEALTEETAYYNDMAKKPVKNNIQYLKRKNSYCVTDVFQWYICREFGYCGGLCGSNINHVGEILNNVTCADLTSDYPAQLSHRQYPTGRLKRIKSKHLNDERKKLDANKKPYFAVILIKHIQAKTPHAVLSQHKIINFNTSLYPSAGTPKNIVQYNGKIYKGDNIIICVNDVDLHAYLELYDMPFGVLTLWAFDGYKSAPKWLLNAMWNDYENKSVLKMSGKSNTQEYADSKRNVNTYYGVLAQRDTETLDTVDALYNPIPSKPKTFNDIRRNFWLNPYIAFYCTSYARAILMHFIARYPDSIVQYDTDSLYFIDDNSGLKNALINYNKQIEKKNYFLFRDRENAQLFTSLGTWEFETTYKKFLALGAKKYIKQDDKGIHTVIAGLPKTAIPSEIEEKGLKAPFDFYNPLIRYVDEMSPKIIIEHMFSNKFASAYSKPEEETPHFIEVTDYLGNTVKQTVGSYHAIVPIDFTLSLAETYIKHILQRRQNE